MGKLMPPGDAGGLVEGWFATSRGSSGVGWVRPQKSEGGNTVLSLFQHDFPHSSLSFPSLPPPRFSPAFFHVYPMTWSLPILAQPLPTSSYKTLRLRSTLSPIMSKYNPPRMLTF